RLLDYGAGKPSDMFMLFVPSLINRYYILDLEPERSLLRWLAEQGIHPMVLDWGAPGEKEASYGVDDYVREILLPAIDFIHEMTGEKVALGGYCMGGVLALAASQFAPRSVSSLALFATPWNFHCKAFSPFVLDPAWQRTLSSMIGKNQFLPAEVIQS